MRIPLGYTQITSLSSAEGLGSIPKGTYVAVIQAEAGDLRWRDDGTAPTTTVGMVLPNGSVLEYDGRLSSIQFIAVTAGALVNVSFYGMG
jgi:hypothetical protein